MSVSYLDNFSTHIDMQTEKRRGEFGIKIQFPDHKKLNFFSAATNQFSTWQSEPKKEMEKERHNFLMDGGQKLGKSVITLPGKDKSPRKHRRKVC